jgi:hypothetical protein
MAKTRGEEIIEYCNAALQALRQRSFQSYSRHDISEILEPLTIATLKHEGLEILKGLRSIPGIKKLEPDEIVRD